MRELFLGFAGFVMALTLFIFGVQFGVGYAVPLVELSKCQADLLTPVTVPGVAPEGATLSATSSERSILVEEVEQ
ncbi:MAG: hypothetical protein Q4C70_05035 [Planctomycetia bacterium]|nr:hypothetical protein [Planctomycetia bacterium]